ncbi:MAG: sodium:dicarboxylate symporter [Planctomycetes bacterium]|jgi:sodium-dependent dicarboxylate transporter 2/3/5|nr:sodium:dicarboxylate symporter [Planctomycetota bacterium]MDP6409959.1 SLC13 family permease [Planctomycetota bacterium]
MESAPLGDGSPSTGRWWRVALGPALAAVIVALGPGDTPSVAAMAAIAAWMAAWWVTEAVPIPVTALLPLVLIPLAGVQPVAEVAPNYGRSTVFLFLGGYLLAIGLQASGVHRRLALWIVHTVGGEPTRVILGFMVAAAFLSMWITNTATVMVLMPIGLSVIEAARDRDADPRELRTFAVTVMLAIAYAADMGGMSTLVGTAPNLSYKEQLARLFPQAPETSFVGWMGIGLPLAVVFVFAGWLLLTRVLFRSGDASLLGSREAVARLRGELGPLRRDERLTAILFTVTALLWITRRDITIGGAGLPGWGSLPLIAGSFIDDSVVAVGMAILLFLIPSQSRPGERLLEWRMSDRMPWGMLLLFGGGFALADGFGASGLSLWMGGHFSVLEGAPPFLVIVLVCASLTFLTELTSNTATTEMALPILGAAAVAMNTDPRALMIPATLSASCAFMMPVASPTQAIVFGSGWVPIRQMVRAGIWFNLIGIALVTLVFWALCGPVAGIDPGSVPEWIAP